MAFFNSLRELGTSLTLLESDIPDYLRVLRVGRRGYPSRDLRRIRELTSRLRDDESPRPWRTWSEGPAGQAIDVCLASSIIEVGIDIDRLSLMAILGQPKTHIAVHPGDRTHRPQVVGAARARCRSSTARQAPRPVSLREVQESITSVVRECGADQPDALRSACS